MAGKELNIAWLVIVLIMAMLFFALSLISLFMRYQLKKNELLKRNITERENFEQTLLQSQIEVQESTLSTLSKELHDNIGQLLSTAKMLLGITERNIANPPDTLLTANATIGKAINELRSLSKSLSKEWLEQFDLIENLNTEVNRLNSADGITLHLLQTDRLLLKAEEQIILFRIIQEAVQNAIKHAFAKNIYIDIQMQQQVLLTSVRDDGNGFDLNKKPDGVGILNMKHRAKLLGGTILWNCNTGGCIVLIKLPVKIDNS